MVMKEEVVAVVEAVGKAIGVVPIQGSFSVSFLYLYFLCVLN